MAKLFCAKDGCQEDMTAMSFNDIIVHDIQVHGDDFLRECLTRSDVEQLPETPETILEALKANPGMVYIAHGQKTMYTHWGNDMMLCFVGDFKDMSPDEVNLYIQKSIKAAKDV